jgi:dynamin 1-like protein
MEQLIPVASKLQDVLGAIGQTTSLDLPQIVVVGGQSSGKSSVLEAIVGRSFLPRGHGIVTRRPLVLQLYNTNTPSSGMNEDDIDDDIDNNDNGLDLEEEDKENQFGNNDNATDDDEEEDPAGMDQHQQQQKQNTEWGEFLHLPGKRYYNFTSIRNEIIRDTNRLTGQNKGINATPIHLKIYSPHVLPLTMVDLPGIAKVAIGDQPEDIEQQIRDMCFKYIDNPNAVILAVTSANTDLANSDALKMAREADPNGERTLGVLTKLDLMDPGTDACDILKNKVIALRKGYIGVVNRGQKDVECDLSIRDGLRKEMHFFRNHPTYGHDRTLEHRLGTKNLAKSLNSILMHHIRECLPELKIRIANMMNDVQMELLDLGNGSHHSNNLGGQLLSLLSKFTTNFSATIEGRGNMINPSSGGGGGVASSPGGAFGNMNTHMNMNTAPTTAAAATHSMRKFDTMDELFGGARISYIFNEIFGSSLCQLASFDGLTDDEIRTTICNANGTRPALFVPEMSFDILARRQISRLEQPGIECVDMVYQELQRIASQCEPGELTRFPNLRDRMVEVVNGLLKRAVGPTQMMVSNLIKIELAYINTSHPDFIGGSQAVAQLMRKLEKKSKSNGIPNEVGVSAEASSHANMAGEGGTVTGSPMVSDSNHHNGLATPASGKNHGLGAHHEGPGGIMNFIFGGKTPSKANGRASSTAVHLPQVPDTMRQSDAPITDREQVEMEIIKSLIDSYFSIVRKNFIDMVPKTIMYFLVNHVRDAMQNELVAELYRDAEIHSLMKEADDVALRRKTCVEMSELLSRALEIVNEVRDFNTFK